MSQTETSLDALSTGAFARTRRFLPPRWWMWLAACLAIVGTEAMLGPRALPAGRTQIERAFAADPLTGPAPELRLPSRGDGVVELARLRGKVVLVNFWATWCPPCRAEEPGIDRLSRIFDPSSLEIIAASADESWEPVDTYFGARIPGYIVALDADASVRNRWGTNQFPETWVVDPSGSLRFKIIGARDWTSPEALTLLEQLGARRR